MKVEYDEGADTQHRYRVQAGLAALYALEMLHPDGNVSAVSVETKEDSVNCSKTGR